jgi:hypothetical protein
MRLLADSGQPRPRTSYRDDLVTVVLGVWFVVGLFLDAWAHNNIPRLETFFTPWHAVFYTGFAATGLWICWLVFRQLRAGRTGAAAVPVGYGLAVLALPVFGLFGILDYAWHTMFGIEQEFKILFSPTHVVGVTAMVVIVTSPLRAAWADRSLPPNPSLRRLLPAVLSLAFGSALVLLFLQYANALVWGPHWIVYTYSEPTGGDRPPVDTLSAAIVVTNLVLLAPLLLLVRRWRVPAGTATILYVAVAGLCAAITAFRYPSILVTMVVAGALVDVLLATLAPREDRRGAYLTFAALAPLVTWGVYFAVAAVVVGHLPDVVEFWTGVPAVAALLGLLTGVLLNHRVADAQPADPVRDEVEAEQRPVG